MTSHPPALRVLMIEDNPGDVRLMQEAMADPGGEAARVSHAGSLSEGMEQLGCGQFDAVLLDLSLPDSHGLDTIERLRVSSPHMPVVVMTSLDDEAMAVRAVAAGAQDYLVKGKDAEGRIVVRALRYAVERQHSQQLLAEASKLEAMGRLAGAVAHEYNTLITTVLACADMALDAAAGQPDLQALVHTIRRAALRAAAITEQVLAIGGRKRLSSSGLALNGAILAAEHMLRAVVGTRAGLTLRLDAPFDAVMFDSREVEHILTILALHALEGAREDSRLDVQTSNDTLDTVSARRLGLRPGLHVVLTVQHSGTRLLDHASPNSLEPFPKPGPAGLATSGLSLAGVNGTLRACGALLAVESESTRGTTFTIHFPHRSNSPEGTGEPASPPPVVTRAS